MRRQELGESGGPHFGPIVAPDACVCQILTNDRHDHRPALAREVAHGCRSPDGRDHGAERGPTLMRPSAGCDQWGASQKRIPDDDAGGPGRFKRRHDPVKRGIELLGFVLGVGNEHVHGSTRALGEPPVARIEGGRPSCGHRTEDELGVVGVPDLGDRDTVERSREDARDLGGDGEPAARQAVDQRFLTDPFPE